MRNSQISPAPKMKAYLLLRLNEGKVILQSN